MLNIKDSARTLKKYTKYPVQVLAMVIVKHEEGFNIVLLNNKKHAQLHMHEQWAIKVIARAKGV